MIKLIFAGIVIVFAIILGTGQWLNKLEKKFRPGQVRLVMRIIAGLLCVTALWLMSSYYFVSDQRHPVYRGLEVFGFGEVILSATLLGFAGMILLWSKLPVPSILLALLGGIAIMLKPIIRPLLSESFSRNGPMTPYSLTSETHLYFLLSGAALAFLGILLLVHWRKPKLFRELFS